MRRELLRLGALAVVLASSFMGIRDVRAQDGTSEEDHAVRYRFGLSVDAVHLAATVVDKKGRLVTDLEQADFLVYEEGVPQEIAYFARGIDAPVDLVLLVDASGSMDVGSKVANARNSAVQLIHTLGPEDRVAVYAFDRHLIELCSFTEEKDQAIQALEGLEPFGSTAIHDAVAEVSKAVEHEGFGRRAIVLITDGIDTASELSVAEASEIAKGVDLPIYAIRVLSPLDDPANEAFLSIHGRDAKRDQALETFTERTGGRLYEASQLGALRLASLRIREELKTQYRLGYVPRDTRRDGRFRRIEVYVRQPDVEVRTRKGYYARRRGDSSESTQAGWTNDPH